MSATTPSQVKNALKRCLWGIVDPHPKDKTKVWKYFDSKCAYCGKCLELGKKDGHLDHLLPATRHKSNALGNFVLSCARCNGDEKRELEWTEFFRNKVLDDEFSGNENLKLTHGWKLTRQRHMNCLMTVEKPLKQHFQNFLLR